MKCQHCGYELEEKLTCPRCDTKHFEAGGKLHYKGIDSKIYQPKPGHPDTCNCRRMENGKIVWTDGCLEDGFVEWQKEEMRRRGENR